MQKVKVSVTLEINPPAPPPLVSDQSAVTLDPEVVGVSVPPTPIAKISGGTPPYSASIDPDSPSALPPGLSLSVDEAGNLSISGTPEAAGAGTFVVAVSDSGA